MFDVDINPEQLEKFTQNSNQGEFVMLNLLKFKPEGGKEYYARYLAESSPFAKAIGAGAEYFGLPQELLIGRDEWDVVMMVKYPSRQAFLDLISNPGYLETHKWREKGVERSVLYPSTPASVQDFVQQTLAAQEPA